LTEHLEPQPTQDADRRIAPRYPLEVKASVHKKNGETVVATAANISTKGMLLQVDQTSGFQCGDEVTVEIELEGLADQPFSNWGVAKVVRVDGCTFGIELQAGTFHSGT
jgi:hypothetical protein